MSQKRTAIIVGILFVVLAFLLATGARRTVEHQKITVVFRYDDYSSRSPTNFEIKLIDAFQRYNIPCTFGIIPYVSTGDGHDPHPQQVMALSEEKAGILKSAVASGIVEPALHGYSHQTIRDCQKGGCTEFSGLSYKKQMEKIVEGKKLLEDRLDTRISTFIPPWNSYDMNTLRCVEELGFNCISANLQGVSEKSSHLKFLPATCTIPELREAIDSARHSSDPQPVIVVLFHTYDFIELGGQGKFAYHDFSDLMAWIASQEDVRVSSISQITQVGNFGANRFRKNKECFMVSRFLPPFLLRHLGSYHVYFSPYSDTNIPIRIWTTAAIFASVTLLVSTVTAFLMGILLFRQFALLASFSKYCAPALLAFLLIYVLHDLTISYRGLTALVVMLGICIGVWASLLKKVRCSY